VRGMGRFLTVVVAIAAIAALPAAASAKKKSKSKPISLITRTATASVAAPDGPITATATCPARTTAVSGGVYAATDKVNHLAFITESVRVGENQWRASGLVSSATPASPQTLITEVYCAKLKGKITTVPSESVLPGTSGVSSNSVASCPLKTHVLSGGFTGPLVTDPGNATIGAPSSSVPAGNGWSTTMTRVTNKPFGSLQNYAYCFKAKKSKGTKSKKAHPRPLTTLTATGAIPVAMFSDLSLVAPLCKSSLRAVSGGFTMPPLATTEGALTLESRRVAGAWKATFFRVNGPSPLPASVTEGCA
jgi:hypothetical protein